MAERRFEHHTVVVLRRPADAPTFTEEELEDLQERHLAHLAGLRDRGVLLATGPFSDQDDETLRGMCVFAAPPEDARRLMAEDPMVRVRRLEAVVATWMAPSGAARFGGPED
jgi:uncharacterized protein YciI